MTILEDSEFSFELLDSIVDKLSDSQKRAILLFGTTKNKYRYKDEMGFYGEPFLWDDSKWTSESAPWNVLHSIGPNSYTNKYALLFYFHNRYSGDYYFLTDLGRVVLEVLRARENIDGWIMDIKMKSRPPGGLRL